MLVRARAGYRRVHGMGRPAAARPGIRVWHGFSLSSFPAFWEPVGFKMNLRRRWGMGPFFRLFSLNRYHYSPQIIEKISPIFHLARRSSLNPAGPWPEKIFVYQPSNNICRIQRFRQRVCSSARPAVRPCLAHTGSYIGTRGIKINGGIEVAAYGDARPAGGGGAA